jgi:hypothetical protein
VGLNVNPRIFLMLAIVLGCTAAIAAPVSLVQVRVVLGAGELGAGSLLELRIYEAGKPVRRLALTHGESWPRNSTRVIPVQLTEPLDPRGVARYSLYYRAASPLAPALEIVSAEVDLSATERLLKATLTGVLAGQGELATEEREAAALTCHSDGDCDDHRSCNGRERCAPRAPGADARGCVKGQPVSCPVNEVCSETRGCLGPDAIAAK